MKNWKWGIAGFLVILFCLMDFTGNQAQAATCNVIAELSETPPPDGKWVRNAKGYRFRDAVMKKYLKNKWFRLNQSIYYADGQGYCATGLKKYKKNLYFFNARGRLKTGWQTIDGNKYYFSKKSGEAYTGWKKIGAKKYCFNPRGILQTNVWVKDTYVGNKGYAQAGKRIFVGDSRTIGLQKSVGSNDVYIAKWGEGYSWFLSGGKMQLETVLKKNPYSCVILNLGVNDMANVEQYIQTYQLLRSKYKKARFYFLSLNPVEEKCMKENGYYTRNNEEIQKFNERMKLVFGTYYIDSYQWMLDRNYISDVPEGCGTVDGLHYIDAVYQMLYEYVLSNAK